MLVISWQATFGSETKGRFEMEFSQRKGQSEDEMHEMMTRAQFHNARGITYNTRFLFTVLPKKSYTGKCAPAHTEFLNIMADEACKLMFDGINVNGIRYFPICLGVKGDAPSHVKVGGLKRSFQNLGKDLGCCFECLAGRPGVPFEDTSPNAAWEATVGVEAPWSEPGPLLKIPALPFNPQSFYMRDPFHTFKQSLGGHFVASAIILLCELGYWPGQGNSVDARLDRAYLDFAFYVKHEFAGKHVAHIKHFTKALMHFPRNDSYPYGRFKGSDCMLMVRWLRHMLVQGVYLESHPGGRQQRSPLNSPIEDWHGPLLSAIVTGSTCAVEFFHLMHREGIWLSRPVASQMADCIYKFNESYMCLATLCFRKGLRRFHLEPCMHAWAHFAHDISSALQQGARWIMSPGVANCEACEDFVGRVSRLTRCVHASGCTLRTVQRYMLKVHSVWENW